MAKLQSSLLNMLLSLTAISLVAAAMLAGVYTLTADKIAQQNEQAKLAAQQKVLCGVVDGVAIEVETNGFGGKMRIMVGFDQEGNILGYEVLEHQETPGLGDKSTTWFKNADKPGQNIVGRKATGSFTVSKDGGDVDAITAATISSRAFLGAINAAYEQFKAAQGETVEAYSGASIVEDETVVTDEEIYVEKEDIYE